jgi:beta-glucanase (GH16 family)
MNGSLAIMMVLAAGCAGAGEWELVWSDEFDRPGAPDPEKWRYEEGFVRNKELQYYTRERRENARVEDGALVIEARRERMANPRHDPKAGEGDWAARREQAEYTSASLTTQGVAAWARGRVEVRAKLPTGRGLWPAIWLLRDSGTVYETPTSAGRLTT